MDVCDTHDEDSHALAPNIRDTEQPPIGMTEPDTVTLIDPVLPMLKPRMTLNETDDSENP